MTELSNAVTVLIARMESHPEDFDLYNGELYNKAKFGETAGALYGLVGMDAGKAGAYWFLSDADKEALIEAWKKYHRVAMEKEVFSKIFDDDSEERERELQLAKMEQQRQQMYQQKLAAQAQQTQNTLLQGGLFGSGGNAAQGMAIQGGSYGGQGLIFNTNKTNSGTLTIGTETIDSSLIAKLKALVK